MRDEHIKVYSSVGALLATFTCDAADEIADQKELLYNPRVEIDEDSSTATFDIFKDSDAWFKISGEDKIYEIDGRRYFIYGEPSETSDAKMVHVTLHELWHDLDTKMVQAYNVSGELEYIGEYTVSLMPFSSAPLYVNGTVRPNPYTKDNLGYYIWAILQDTGFSLAYCNVVDDTYDAVNLLSAFELDTEGISVLENLNLLRKLTSCIFKWDTINKELRVYDKDVATSEINKWQGYEIREGVNLVKGGISKRTNTNIVTRVIPYGYDNLVISSVNSGLVYLDNNSYSPKVYAKIIQNPDIQTPQALKVWATKELAKMCRPTVEYEADFIWRQDEDYGHEKFDLYDIVRVVYNDTEVGGEITDKQRIISLSYDVWKKSAFKAVLGDKKIRWLERLNKSIANGILSGNVISSSGTISAGSVYYGSSEKKKRLSSVIGGVESTIAQIEATADSNRANVELISMYTNAAKGVKSVQEYTPLTWDKDYIYYVSQGANTGYWKWEVSEWVLTQTMAATLATINVTASKAAADVQLLAKYTSSIDEIVEVADTSGQATWNVGFVYYVTSTDKFYKHNGTAWVLISQITTQIASIETKANQNESKISLVVEQVEGVNVVKAASIVTAINESGGSVTINADKINLQGYVTITDLGATGTTAIDGARISTGTVSADRIDADNLEVNAANIAGKLTASQIDVSGVITAGALAVKGDIPEKISELYNDLGLKDYDGVVSIIGGTVDADFISSKGIVITSGGDTIFSAIQTGDGGAVVISPTTLEITTSGDLQYIDFGSPIRAPEFMLGGETGMFGDGNNLTLASIMGTTIFSEYGAISLSASEGVKVTDKFSIPSYPDVTTTLNNIIFRLDALDGGCGVCQSGQCGSCDTCDTCQSGQCGSCDTCDTCQSGDEPEYDYYVGDTFEVYFDQGGSQYLDLDGFEIDEYDSDRVYLLCVREGWCSYQLMESGEPLGELVELYIGPDPNRCDSCDAYWDGGQWTN